LTYYQAYANILIIMSEFASTDPERQNLISEIKARWLIETEGGIPYANLDLDSSLADQLRLKNDEYALRAEKALDKRDFLGHADAKFKHVALGLLLERGHIDLVDTVSAVLSFGLDQEDAVQHGIITHIIKHWAEPENKSIHITQDVRNNATLDMAANAFFVIQAYASGNTEQLNHGTGLPSIP
jgi:hypothetical protein